jgi:hypothetical protein
MMKSNDKIVQKDERTGTKWTIEGHESGYTKVICDDPKANGTVTFYLSPELIETLWIASEQ